VTEASSTRGDPYHPAVDLGAGSVAHTGLDLVESLSRRDLQGHTTYKTRPESGARQCELPCSSAFSAGVARRYRQFTGALRYNSWHGPRRIGGMDVGKPA
jgi:hypothetical protein